MRINTFRKLRFTAELWHFTTTRDAEGGEINNYFLDRVIRLNATTSGQGRLFIFLGPDDDDIVLKDQIMGLRDSNGTTVVQGGIWEVADTEPIFDMYGRRQGFKVRCEFFGIDNSIIGAGG